MSTPGSSSRADCIVIGGGISGLLAARELAGAGLRVTLLERGASGSEASWAGGGILSPLSPWRYAAAVNRLAHWSQIHYPDLAADLVADTGIDPEWTASGMLYVDEPDTDIEPAHAWAERFRQPLAVLTPPEAAAVEPALGPCAGGALWLPEIAQIRTPRLMRALRAAVVLLGVDLREQVEVQGITVHGSRVSGVHIGGEERLAAPRVLVATGAWTGRLLAGLHYAPAVEPVRGQMLLFQAPPGLLKRIVVRGAHYLIPRRDGRILAGSTLEFVGFDKSTTPRAREDLHIVALALVPALADAALVQQWAGLRPGAPAGIPYIGEHPEIAGLFINAGHYRNGLVLGPASARLVADLMLDREPILDPAPYGFAAERA